jgi:hypothetical protein
LDRPHVREWRSVSEDALCFARDLVAVSESVDLLDAALDGMQNWHACLNVGRGAPADSEPPTTHVSAPIPQAHGREEAIAPRIGDRHSQRA